MAIREKVWVCASCDKNNLGRYKECLSCGSPREKGEMRSMRGQGTSVAPVTDPELLRLARAGSDWFCTHCTAGKEVPDTCYQDKQVFDHKECWDVTDYCDKKLYESKCDYKTQEWQASRTVASSGSGTKLYWEETPVGPLQRATYSATTNRVISYVDGQTTKEYSTSASHTSKSMAESSASEYLTWKVGELVILDVNNFGGVVGEPHRGGVR